MAFRIKAFLLVLFLLLIPLLSSGMAEGFRDGMHPKYSLYKVDAKMNMRKLLALDVVLDYDDAGANPKHEPRKKPPPFGGKP